MKQMSPGQERIWLAGLLLLHLGLCLAFWTPHPDWGGDWAGYLMQAETLRTGDWAELEDQTIYRQTHSRPLDSPDYYPWGFPLLLLPAVSLGGAPYVLAKLSLIACSVLVLWAVYAWLRPYLPPWGRLGLISCLAVHPWLLQFPQQILSGLPFWLASVGWLWAMDRWCMRQSPANRVSWQSLTLGALLFLGLWFRGQGLVWVLAMGLIQAIQIILEKNWQHWRQDLLVWLSVGLMMGLDRLLLPHGSGYGQFFAWDQLLTVVRDMSLYYAKVLLRFFVPMDLDAPWAIGMGVILLVGTIIWACYGWWQQWSQHWAWLLASAMVVAVLLIYPFKEGYRFWLSLLPLGLFGMIKGIEAAANPWQHLGQFWLALLILSSGLGTGYTWMQLQATPLAHPLQQADLWRFMQSELPASATITTAKPRIVTYLTGHQATFSLSQYYPSQASSHLLIARDSIAHLSRDMTIWLDQQVVAWEDEQYLLIEIQENKH